MDRQTILGFVLILILLMIWMTMNAPPPAPSPSQEQSTPGALDTPQVGTKSVSAGSMAAVETRAKEKTNDYGSFFQPRAQGTEKIVIIETDLFTAEISSRGGTSSGHWL